jgi:hypothetical protein
LVSLAVQNLQQLLETLGLQDHLIPYVCGRRAHCWRALLFGGTHEDKIIPRKQLGVSIVIQREGVKPNREDQWQEIWERNPAGPGEPVMAEEGREGEYS